jgi:two-component system, NtrC family, nitrogen regulation sensor histidine kinase NtrY
VTEPEKQERASSDSVSASLTERGRRRLTTVIVLSSVVLLLLLSLVAQSGFNPEPFVMPDTAGETLLLYTLTTLNFLAFVTVLFVLLRNILKLTRERRAGRLGSKFKARLVSYAIGLSLLPVLLLFFFSFGLLNRSIDRWFGEPARQIVDDAKTIEESYFKKEETETASLARAVSRSLGLGSRADYGSPLFERELRREVGQYNLAIARLVAPGHRITVERAAGQSEREIEETLRAAESAARLSVQYTGRDEGVGTNQIYIIAAVRVSDAADDGRLLIIAREFPPELTRLAANINEQHGNFHSLLGKIKRIKAIYILLLAAVALLLIFAAIWLALHVARGITVPIQALAEATDRVAHGDFARPVVVAAEDELAALVSSFNQMSAQLGENRERLEHAAEDLHRTNLALDDRRRYIETVLESLSTGVISTDEKTGIATINRAALSMLGLENRPEIGTHIAQIIAGKQGEDLASLCRRARRSETAQSEIQFRVPDGTLLHTATTAIALRNTEGAISGWVIVIEDLTDLIQAERAAAWSEVARRMAHEIKNPLTPIQLSAERILRNYTRSPLARSEPRFGQVIAEGTATIVREVATLQRMVEEFSRFARLPEAQPRETSLNDVVRDAVKLYAERLDRIRIVCALADDLPVLRLDPEQMKRVLVNLIDNSVEALTSNGNGGGNGSLITESESVQAEIRIETKNLKAADAIRLIVADTGHGIRPADRDKLFLPKFSTRDRGTGLGLAIVSHIVADHKGRIWVEDNQPRGARFIVELPSGRGE